MSVSWVGVYFDHPIHLFAEILLFFLLVYIYSIKSYKPVDESLSQNEEEELIREWQPEPLISPELIEEARNQPQRKIIQGFSGPHVKIEGKDYVSFASNGFLGYQCHPKVIDSAIQCTGKYGVGACGPRGFYGSISPHMELEKRLAQFMNTDEAVIFSSEFQTIASVIPAFAKPGDYVICDKGVCFAIQNGVLLSRSFLKWYEHNDIQDLQRILHSLNDVFKRQKHRVFVVAESIYANYGDMLKLSEILKLKEKYPFRIILDESFSIGVLGKKGRGITDFLEIPASSVDIITASTGNALGSVGGFACGTAAMGSHMRLNCNGYVFSCSLPPYLATSAVTALDLIESSPEISALQKNIHFFHETMKSLPKFSSYYSTSSSENSPYIHLRLSENFSGKIQETIGEISDALMENGIVVGVSKYSKREAFPPPPSLKICLSAGHTQEEIKGLLEALFDIATKKFQKVK